MNLIVGLLSLVAGVLMLGMIICLVITIVKMFQYDDSGLGILSICLLLLCGIGGLVAFCIGWSKVDDYNNRSVMMAWSGLFVANIIVSILIRVAQVTM